MTKLNPSFYSVVALAASLFLFMFGNLTASGEKATPPAAVAAPSSANTVAMNTVSADALHAPVGIAHVPAQGQPLASLAQRFEALDPALPSNTLALPDVRRLQPLPPAQLKQLDSETLWLARCIYSETKRPEEQELVAWVIRNRVETGYRGQRTFRDVVLDPYQFSAFNPGTRTRAKYARLTAYSKAAGWQKALRIAHEVRRMPASLRPFSNTTRHFYSARSMKGRRAPAWAHGQAPVKPLRNFAVDAQRFRFFENIT